MKSLMPVLMALLLCACPAETSSSKTAGAAGVTGERGPEGPKGDTGDPGLPGQPLRFYLRVGSTGPIIYERNRPDLCWPEEVSDYYGPFRYNPDLDACISVNQDAVVWYAALNCAGTAYFANDLGQAGQSYDPEELVRPTKPLKAIFLTNGGATPGQMQIATVRGNGESGYTFINALSRRNGYPSGICTNVTAPKWVIPFAPVALSPTPFTIPFNKAVWVLAE